MPTSVSSLCTALGRSPVRRLPAQLYVLVQLDSVPEAARSVKILVQRGSQVSTPLIPLALPNSGTAGLSFRLDLPPVADESQPSMSRSAPSVVPLVRAACWPPGTRAQPREVAPVHVAPIADLATCTEGDVIVQSVTPNLLPNRQAEQHRACLKGLGISAHDADRDRRRPRRPHYLCLGHRDPRHRPAAKRVGMQPISSQNQGSAHTTSGLLAYYSNQVTYTSMPPTSWNELGISHPVWGHQWQRPAAQTHPSLQPVLTTEFSLLTPGMWSLDIPSLDTSPA